MNDAAYRALFAAVSMLGGLALFLFGMDIMTSALRSAAAGRIRKILAFIGRSPAGGLAAGLALGATIQTSATTITVLGLINAGLMRLEETMALLLGANIGTTLAMYIISLRLGELCFVFIAAGLLLRAIGGIGRAGAAGTALLGFGLLFLGMNVMNAALVPYKAALTPLLTQIDGTTWRGMLLGVAVSTALTAITQSSGATIAVVFSLISAGAITRLEQSFPIIIGANVGTCLTALLAGIGADIEAKRFAAAHLLFNIFSAACAIAAAGLFFKLVPMLSGDVTLQTAHANTLKMAATALPLLAFSCRLARAVRRLTPSRKAPREPSRLEESLLDRPEDALRAVICELRRAALICIESFAEVEELLRHYNRLKQRKLALNEDVIDEIKIAVRSYLQRMTRRYMSRRQALLMQYLNNAMVNIERIHDHVEMLSRLSAQRAALPKADFDCAQDLWEIYKVYHAAAGLLRLLAECFNADMPEFQTKAKELLDARGKQLALAHHVLENYTALVGRHERRPICGMFFTEYISAFNRIGRHCAETAMNLAKPEFHLKPAKFGRIAEPAPEFLPPTGVGHDENLHWIFREHRDSEPDPQNQRP